MAHFGDIEDQKLLLRTGAAFGTSGTFVSKLIWGSACLNCPSAIGDATVVGASLAVTGVVAGDALFVMPNASMPATMVLKSACCVTGGISASWINSASESSSGSFNVTVSYLVVG